MSRRDEGEMFAPEEAYERLPKDKRRLILALPANLEKQVRSLYNDLDNSELSSAARTSANGVMFRLLDWYNENLIGKRSSKKHKQDYEEKRKKGMNECLKHFKRLTDITVENLKYIPSESVDSFWEIVNDSTLNSVRIDLEKIVKTVDSMDPEDECFEKSLVAFQKIKKVDSAAYFDLLKYCLKNESFEQQTPSAQSGFLNFIRSMLLFRSEDERREPNNLKTIFDYGRELLKLKPSDRKGVLEFSEAFEALPTKSSQEKYVQIMKSLINNPSMLNFFNDALRMKNPANIIAPIVDNSKALLKHSGLWDHLRLSRDLDEPTISAAAWLANRIPWKELEYVLPDEGRNDDDYLKSFQIYVSNAEKFGKTQRLSAPHFVKLHKLLEGSDSKLSKSFREECESRLDFTHYGSANKSLEQVSDRGKDVVLDAFRLLREKMEPFAQSKFDSVLRLDKNIQEIGEKLDSRQKTKEFAENYLKLLQQGLSRLSDAYGISPVALRNIANDVEKFHSYDEFVNYFHHGVAAQGQDNVVKLGDVRTRLEVLASGIAGVPLSVIETNEEPVLGVFSYGKMVLPPVLAFCKTADENFRVYRALAAFQAVAHEAPIHRFQEDFPERLAEHFRQRPDVGEKLLDFFDSIYVLHHLKREYPGLKDDADLLVKYWAHHFEELDTVSLESPERFIKKMRNAVLQSKSLVMTRYKGLDDIINKLSDAHSGKNEEELMPTLLRSMAYAVEAYKYLKAGGLLQKEDSQVLLSAPVVRRSLVYRTKPSAQKAQPVVRGEGGFLYPEWNSEDSSYRNDWARVHEKIVDVKGNDFAQRVMSENRRVVEEIRRLFERMKPLDNKTLKFQYDGEIDWDLYVQSVAERKAGVAPSEKIFTSSNTRQRSVATAIVLELSGTLDRVIEAEGDAVDVTMPELLKSARAKLPSLSDNDRANLGHLCNSAEALVRSRAPPALLERFRKSISPYLAGQRSKRGIDVVREACAYMCEALNVLGDDFGLYAYTGEGRENVNVYSIKDMYEPYSDLVLQRLGSLVPGGQNRNGAAIRHVFEQKLLPSEKRAKILISIDDGKPEDMDYKGKYAREDTKQALLEVKNRLCYPLSVVVNNQPDEVSQAKEMLDGLWYTVISDIRQLPKRLPEIYRRITC